MGIYVHCYPSQHNFRRWRSNCANEVHHWLERCMRCIFLSVNNNCNARCVSRLHFWCKKRIEEFYYLSICFNKSIVLTFVSYFFLFLFQKVSKRLHLSKVKLAKFNESSQLVLFYILSIIWGIDIIIRFVIQSMSVVSFHVIEFTTVSEKICYWT